MSTPDKDLRYSITAEDRFSRTFQNLRRDVLASRDNLGTIVTQANAVNLALGSIALGAAGGAGLALGIRQLANDLDALNDAADATGDSIENLSALEDVARRNGDSLEVVVTAATKLNKVLSEATPGSAMARTLEAIGLSAAQLRNDDPSIAVQKVAQALAGYADDQFKARLVQDLFNKSLKELAPFLKDVAEAGQLNATVTAAQAAEAEKFNKTLAAMATSSSNTARAIASELLPAINEYADLLKRVNAIQGGKLFKQELVSEAQSLRLKVVVADIEALTDQLSRQPGNTTLQKLLADARQEYELLSRAAAAANEQLKATLGIPAQVKEAGAGRGFINPPEARPSVPGVAAAPTTATAPKVSEAQRYLEALQKQGEKLQDLTTLQQLLKDIENKRIDGITPKLEAELKLAAQRVDLQKRLNDEKQREVDFQKALADKDQRDIDQVQALLANTTSGQLQGMESQVDKLLAFSGRIGQDDPRQKQISEALAKLSADAKKLTEPADTAATAYEQLADSIEKSMERSTSAVIDFALGSNRSFSDLGRSIAFDVIRGQIEEPLRASMKQLGTDITSFVTTAGTAIKSVLSNVGSSGSSGSGFDWSSLFSTIGGFFGRANGGSVSAGSTVRWQENGREWFVPGADGAVVNQAQMRGLMGGGSTINQTNTYVIQGGDAAQTQRQIEAAIAANNAQLMRSSRTGGQWAAA